MRRIKFPWYDFPFVEAEYSTLWSKLSGLLRAEGFEDLPMMLDPSADLDGLLRSPHLLCSQTCGYDIAVAMPLPLTMIFTPCFDVEGCGRGTYRSLVVVKKESERRSLADLSGARFVANDDRSWSGFHCLRDHFLSFDQTIFSGSHLESLRFLKLARADVAAIDCVTWALLLKHSSETLEPFRVIGRTRAVPAPPLVTSRQQSEAEVLALRRALLKLVRTEQTLFRRLMINDFVLFRNDDYKFMAPGGREGVVSEAMIES